MDDQPRRPLDGIVVVALEQAVAAPFATRQLADWGARVIKIERPHGGDFARHFDRAVRGQSGYFVWLNRGKESVTLDLKQPRAPGVMARLLARADVFIQNLAPGAARRLGLGADALRARDPRLIVCDLSGFGESGPYLHRKAYDLLIQAETGLLSITGGADQPARVGISVADIAGGMYAYSGILTALFARERTGEGSALSVSLFDALGEWMGFPAYYTTYTGKAPARSGAAHPTIAPYGPFRTADGTTVMLAVQTAVEWNAFCARVLDRPEVALDQRYADNASRVANRASLDALVAGVFATLSPADAVTRLDLAGIAHARLNSVEEYLEHPQHGARDRWREVPSPGGPLRALLPPVTFASHDPVMGAIPALGEHTESVWKWVGYDDREIDVLGAERVV
jgi:formyl-CoA transferase